MVFGDGESLGYFLEMGRTLGMFFQDGESPGDIFLEMRRAPRLFFGDAESPEGGFWRWEEPWGHFFGDGDNPGGVSGADLTGCGSCEVA